MKIRSYILVLALVPFFAVGSPANPQAGAHHSTQGLDAARNYAPRLAGYSQSPYGKCIKRCNDKRFVCERRADLNFEYEKANRRDAYARCQIREGKCKMGC